MEKPLKRLRPLSLADQRKMPVADGFTEVELPADKETILRAWETKRNLVLLSAEHTRIKGGLDVLQILEVSPEANPQDVPGLVDAEDLVDAFKDTHPGKSKLELIGLVRTHLDESLRTEISGAKKEGLAVPTAEEAPMIEDYLEIETDTQRILKGLDDLTKNPQTKTREGARAQHFMARVETTKGLGTTDLLFARAHANQRLRLKKAELKKLKILIP